MVRFSYHLGSKHILIELGHHKDYCQKFLSYLYIVFFSALEWDQDMYAIGTHAPSPTSSFSL